MKMKVILRLFWINFALTQTRFMILIIVGFKGKIKRMFVGFGLAPYTIFIFTLSTFTIYVPFGLVLRYIYFQAYANNSTSILFWEIIAFMSILGPVCYVFFTWIYITVNIAFWLPTYRSECIKCLSDLTAAFFVKK